MNIEPYLFFEGRCEEALNFYKKTLGAEIIMMMRFRESPDQSKVAPGTGDKIMHALFRIGDSAVMASDGNCNSATSFQGFGLTIAVETSARAQELFTALGDGGQVQMPLAETFFSPSFGMVNDRFGVLWMIIVESKASMGEKK